jgi:glycerate-2-kinase
VQQELPEGERACLLAGGETVVSVAGRGTGGRNQELALAFALEVAGKAGITLLSAGTDGTDGPTDAAGAVVDGETAGTATRHGMDPMAYLANNDSYAFFVRLDALTGGHRHVKTGPTGTNVMDVQIMVLEGQSRFQHRQPVQELPVSA